MSNNAVSAYEDGQAPASGIAKEIGRGATAKAVAEILRPSSWHHTSCKYNRTNFYDLHEAAVELASDAVAQNKAGLKPIAITATGRPVRAWKLEQIDPVGCQIERAKQWIVAQIVAKARELRASK
jgi:hypothetical protein